jgi:SpoVK/Ycf46/Vps4 family AAA+-type ATPase
MNADFRGFAFATQTEDPFKLTPLTQASNEPTPAKPTAGAKGSPRARPPKSMPGLSSSARNELMASGLLEVVEPRHSAGDLIVSPHNYRLLTEVVQEVRRSEDLRRHGLKPRSKLLFCGPPGCGKTLCAEVLAHEMKMPLVVARLDAIITTYLGETASNLRKIFQAAESSPVVLFLDEFDALARTRTDSGEHSEIRRVVNSLLMMIDRYAGNGILVAATNLDQTIDDAAWRRFDEVLLFERPTAAQIKSTVRMKLRNFPMAFDVTSASERLSGMSFAEIERVCLTAIKRSILDHKSTISAEDFQHSVDSEQRRRAIRVRPAG